MLKTSHTALFTPDDVEYYVLLDIVGGADNLAAKPFWGAAPHYAGIGAFTARQGGSAFRRRGHGRLARRPRRPALRR